MTDLRKAAEMALAKLDHLWEIAVDERMNTDVLPEIKALRQALAESEQKPLVWMNKYGHVASFQNEEYKDPLYTAPPKREWVGLTDEEARDISFNLPIKWTGHLQGAASIYDFARAIEAKLKEKNT